MTGWNKGGPLKLIFVLIICAVTFPSVAGATTVSPPPVYSPRESTVFNNPKAAPPQQLSIITQIDRAIDGTPKAGTIRMAQYLFDIDSTADKLIAAYRRGVNVQVLIDDGTTTPQITRVRKALGRDKTKLSFVTACKHSCMANTASVMHAKFYLFSSVGSSPLVSMVSSANPYTGNTFYSWNNIHTIVGDAKLYGSLAQYFTDMIQDKNNLNYYRTAASGKYKLYLFPRAPRPGVTTVVPLDVLNHVTCSGVASGYGSKGHTVVRVAMWGWTSARLDIAKKLQELKSRGCKVNVILNTPRTSPKVIAALLKRSSKYGVIPVYNAWVDKNHNGKPGLYMHHKLLMINGKWFGHPNTKVSYTGSQNFSGPATVANNDIIMRIIDNKIYDAYNTNLDYVRDHYTSRVTRVPLANAVNSDSRIDELLKVDND